MQLYYEINLGLFNGLIDVNCISHLNLQDTINHMRNKLKQHNIFYIQSTLNIQPMYVDYITEVHCLYKR